MDIPNNITKDHLLQAISKIDKEGIPKDADSRFYDVIYGGKKYPPKLVVAYSNIFANEKELDRHTFSGGLTKQSFKLLEDNGFIISPKLGKSYYGELMKFLKQAKTTDLKTSSYLKKYAGLKVKVSFGQGTLARVPWISFLGENQTTSNGIYPVYLLYKDYGKLILAYGISESTKPNLNWVTDNPTLSQYFDSNNIGDPKPYPKSFVFKSYDLKEDLDEEDINIDLLNLIEIYKHILAAQPIPQQIKRSSDNFQYTSFLEKASIANLFINQNLGLRFTASLLTKPFVILTGLSGSGKTKVAQAFAMWICESDSQYCIIPVGADWTNREPLLGFPNSLEKESYVTPDNGALNIILEASKEENNNKPYFLILDEMNLSHVERYFSDFLSVMESKDKKGILLHSDINRKNSKDQQIPNNIKFPRNLFIIGTVNIDETTYMFSPKVLDRANVIEFRVTEGEMGRFLQSDIKINLIALEGLGANMSKSFVEIAHDENLKSKNTEELRKALVSFFSELRKTGAEFGYRSASEILRFASIVNKIEPSCVTTDIIDVAIMQKLLPKLHGSRSKLSRVLPILGGLCLRDNKNIKEIYFDKSDAIDFSKDKNIIYKISFEKICRMYKNAIENGFASYAEA